MKIINGEALDQLLGMPDNSVDAIVTDPPYGLSFMGKKWDYDVPSVDLWKEAFRVLKPGAFLLSFSGTRTYHRMAVNIEDAGFEIRDMISWLYGSGFPKSLNIGRQLAKMNGEKLEGEFTTIKGIASYAQEPSPIKERDKFRHKTKTEWEGWGTALKPACEPIVVARKPLSEKNVALNVLKWGTGGINIDACRVGTEIVKGQKAGQGFNNVKGFGINTKQGTEEAKDYTSQDVQGRFPANIILDEEAGEILDEQSGNNTGAFAPVKKAERPNNVYGKYDYFGDNGKTFRGDKGGASRFFYCAKASKRERNMGCDELEEKEMGRNQSSLDGGKILTGSGNERSNSKKNFHPTVKPIKLMEYLVKLVSKENAKVLDPFMGSGTTGIACVKLNREFIGIEREEDYIKIAEARISAVTKDKTQSEVKR